MRAISRRVDKTDTMHVRNVTVLTPQPKPFARSWKRSDSNGQMCGRVMGARSGRGAEFTTHVDDYRAISNSYEDNLNLEN